MSIPLAVAERLLKKSGASRVSHDAKEAFRDVLEDLSVKIAEKAVSLAKHSGRKTVKGKDVRLAAKDF